MTREEIIKRITEVEGFKFMLQMKDFWDWKDYHQDRCYQTELLTLRKELQEIGG